MAEAIGPVKVECFWCDKWVDSMAMRYIGNTPYCPECWGDDDAQRDGPMCANEGDGDGR